LRSPLRQVREQLTRVSRERELSRAEVGFPCTRRQGRIHARREECHRDVLHVVRLQHRRQLAQCLLIMGLARRLMHRAEEKPAQGRRQRSTQRQLIAQSERDEPSRESIVFLNLTGAHGQRCRGLRQAQMPHTIHLVRLNEKPCSQSDWSAMPDPNSRWTEEATTDSPSFTSNTSRATRPSQSRYKPPASTPISAPCVQCVSDRVFGY
jgi:hypothetical protein